MESLNNALRSKLELQNTQKTELEYVNWTRNDRIQELESERTQLGKQVLNLQEQLAQQTSIMAQKESELQKMNRKRTSNQFGSCQQCDTLQRRSSDLAQDLATKVSEIQRLNDALNLAKDANSTKAQKVADFGFGCV